MQVNVCNAFLRGKAILARATAGLLAQAATK
jgi:hypothetical protein